MSEQNNLDLEETGRVDSVEKYKFEPIKGYPMLNWHGKRPFTSTQYYPAQKKEVYGEEINGWINKIFWGDNLQVMSHLLKEYRGKVNLIYIDPPFDSKADYKKKITLKGLTASSDTNSFEEKQYTDLWNNDEYLQFIYERLILCKELLSKNGIIVVHCDYRKNHHIRCLMEEIFGVAKMVNEIIWKRRTGVLNQSKKFGSASDTLLVFSNSVENYCFNQPYIPYSDDDPYVIKKFTHFDNSGRRYRLHAITSPSYSPTLIYDYKGYKPPENGWAFSRETMEEWELAGKLDFPANKNQRIQRKQYLDESPGKPVQNIWDDIRPINSQSKDDTKYPTQKPIKLLDRIIESFSNEGDVVFDCFMGSGTTQTSAYKLKRKFIGADINLASVQITVKRLIEVNELFHKSSSEDARAGFEVYNVNNYDVFRNPVEAIGLLLEALEIEPLSSSIYDGEKDGCMVKIMPVNRIATREDLNELIANFPYKVFEQRKEQNPSKPVESVILVCMGHEPNLKAHLEQECGYKLDVKVVDILRDKSNIEFKRDSEAEFLIEKEMLKIINFFPMNLMQKLSLQKESVNEWRELVESIVIDWNYDGSAMEPAIVDIPDNNEFVLGNYKIPDDAGTIKVKITDLLSESYEEVIKHG
ncbi:MULTISPECIES: site-specific DNA-methyltransferase [unclassified Marinomonas]|uniref:site-specific DNA-methyltransferase n=1 Tax=unclassified Marinomonas TaxID=196814 RepID=UPI0007AF2A12|nr:MULTISPECIES: site-specific DNA-methyltransferase [unclassified Marinomonas]